MGRKVTRGRALGAPGATSPLGHGPFRGPCLLSARRRSRCIRARGELCRRKDPAPPARQEIRRSIRPGDPERARNSLEHEDDEPAPVEKKAQTATGPAQKKLVRPNDPEQARNSLADENDEPAPVEKKAQPAARLAQKKRARPNDPEQARTPPEEEKDEPAPAKKKAPSLPARWRGKNLPGRATRSRHGFLRQEEEDEPALTEKDAQRPAAVAQDRHVRPDDPEQGRVCPEDEEAGHNTTPNRAASSPERAARAVLPDVPRFLSGEGLDSDAAETVADMAVAQRKTVPPPRPLPQKEMEKNRSPNAAPQGVRTTKPQRSPNRAWLLPSRKKLAEGAANPMTPPQRMRSRMGAAPRRNAARNEPNQWTPRRSLRNSLSRSNGITEVEPVERGSQR